MVELGREKSRNVLLEEHVAEEVAQFFQHCRNCVWLVLFLAPSDLRFCVKWFVFHRRE